MRELAVIILNYKTWRETLEEIQEVHSKECIAYEDIIVVDNASPNESYQQLELSSAQIGFVLIRSEQNKGYASGNNIGLRYSLDKGYKYAWILNNDIILNADQCVSKMISILKKNEMLAVVNPDVYSPEGKLYNRDAVRPTFYDLTFGMVSYRTKGRQITDEGGYAYIYRPQGCCMLVDLEKLSEIDFMDEYTFLYCEEYILAERLLEKRYLCACCTSTKIIHNHSKTVKSSITRYSLVKIKNVSFKYYLKEYRHFGKMKVFICMCFNALKIWLYDK